MSTLNRRKFITITAATICGAAVRSNFLGQESTDAGYEFVNGLWFNGTAFQRNTFYSSGQNFTSKRPSAIRRSIDLTGKFVVPPFGDAHNHSLSGPFNVDSSIRQFLKDGIFYVKNPSNIQRDTNLIRNKLNIPQSVDAIFANGPLTAKGGHPVELYDPGAILNKVKKPGPDGSFENVSFFIVDDESELARKWPLIVADKPDFIKTGVLYSEEFAKRRNDNSYRGYKGLDPRVLKMIVARAHENNLAVSCHVETANDFREALNAGVDEIAHMPGYYSDFARADLRWFLISKADAELAARRKVAVVTTTYVSNAELKSADQLMQAQQIQARNLKLLHTAGARLTIGPDVYGVTALVEAKNLHTLKIFDNLTLLKMWCEATPQSIFPGRQIGRLTEDYECSFLALDGDPIRDFKNVERISARVKQGELLRI